MAKVKEDLSRVRLEVDGKQAINQLGKLEMEAKQLAIDLKQAKRGTQEYIDTNKKLNQTTAQIKSMRKELGISGMTMSQLARYQRELNKEIQNTATFGTARWKELNREYRRTSDELNRQRQILRGNAGFFSDIKKELKSFAVLAVGALGISELFAGFQNLIKGSADLSDQISDVQKTTELTDAEVNQLMKTFKSFNTRTARTELLKLADEAGKMGKRGIKDIAEYVQQTNELTTALGEDLGENAGLKVAKMAERFNVSMRQIGSGINAVADNTKAQAGFITEFLSRLAGTGNEVGIAAGDILGYGAAIDEMGLNVEMSSTALNGFLIDFTKNTEKYGEAAGYAKGELSKLVGEQGTNTGFLAFLERLREANPEAADFLRKLEELGIDGARGSQVFLALAQNVSQLRDRQALANTEIAKGTSLTEEYNKKNQNFAGNLERIQKWFNGFFINGGVLNALDKFVGKWAEWISIPVSTKIEEERINLQKLYSQILTTNVGSQDRIKLVNELQSLYPGLLGNINAETVNNEELALAVKKVNDQLINKVILQKQDEQIEKRNAEIAEKKMALFEQEDKVRALMIKNAEKYGIEIKAANTLEEQAIQVLQDARAEQEKTTTAKGRLFDSLSEYSHQLREMQNTQLAVNGLEEGGNKLLEQKNKLIERLGINMDELNANQSSGTSEDSSPSIATSTVAPVSDEDAKKAKALLDKLQADWQSYLENIDKLRKDYEIAGLGAEQADLKRVEYQYKALEDELKSHLSKKAISQEEYDKQLAILAQLRLQEEQRITKEYRDKEIEAKTDAEQQILEATASEKELAVIQTNKHYDELIALAQQFGLDTIAIEEARRKALDDVQTRFNKKEVEDAAKIAEAKQMIAQGLSASVGAVIDFIGNKQGELSAFQKILTLVGIGIDSAAALGKVVPLAAEAAAGSGPAAPFVFAGYIASMAATVLGAIAKAKNALSNESVPEWNSESSTDKPSARRRANTPSTPKKSYFWGGYTGDEGIGLGDHYGEFAGAVHKNEYVLPQIVTQDPKVANLLPAIESLRQDRMNGYTSGGLNSGGMGSDPEMKALMREMIAAYQSTKSKKVILVTSELEDHEEEKAMLQDRYSS